MSTRIWAIVEKEWAEMLKNKMIIASMALVPILLVGMVLGTIFFMQRMPESEVAGSNAPPIPPQWQHLDPKTAFIIVMDDQYMFYFLLIPMTLPVYIARLQHHRGERDQKPGAVAGDAHRYLGTAHRQEHRRRDAGSSAHLAEFRCPDRRRAVHRHGRGFPGVGASGVAAEYGGT